MDERRFEWDEAKAETNRRRHGVAFEAVRDFRFDLALVVEDDRADYGEVRLVATAPLNGRFHVLVHTMRGETVRVISLRKANDREIRNHVRDFEG